MQRHGVAAATGEHFSRQSIIARGPNGDHTAANGSGASRSFSDNAWMGALLQQLRIQSALRCYNAQGFVSLELLILIEAETSQLFNLDVGNMFYRAFCYNRNEGIAMKQIF